MRKPVTSSELRGVILQRKRLLALFSGKWCPDCTGFEPTWRAWIGAHEIIPAYRVEIDKDGDEWDEWDLDEVPTVILFSDRIEQSRLSGTIGSARLDDIIDEMGVEP